MIPLNIYLQEATPEQMAHAVVEYGNAIKDLVAANIFPGDMLWKNFGVTRHGKVVFYDYDEIEYITDCNFRRVPPPRNEEDEMSARSGTGRPEGRLPRDLRPFLLGNPAVREVFMAHHADLLDAAFWQGHKERILAGHVHDVFPYDPAQALRAPPAPRRSPPESAGRLKEPSHVRPHRHRLRRPHAHRRPARRLRRRSPPGSSARWRSRPRSSAPACPATRSTRC
jgi:hypothetical protein